MKFTAGVNTPYCVQTHMLDNDD